MNTTNRVAFQSPRFTLLSETQLEALHLAALEVLRRTGIRFYHQEALDLLKKAGAFISADSASTGSAGALVKFPARLVQDAVASAPSRIVMCDRDGEPAMFLEGSKVWFGTGSDCLNFLDPETGEHRRFTQADIINGYRLCDGLPHIHFVMSIGLPTDVPPHLAYDVQMALMLEHTSKPIVFVTHDRASCQRAVDMAAAVAGGHERLREQQHILLYSEPSSPLQQSETAVDKLLLMAEYELPAVHSPGPLMGGTAPITMASGLAMSLAEILSALVVHQLKCAGAPFVFGAGLHHMDMSAAQICYGSPEFQLTKTAIAELGRWYGLPTWGYAGCSDAKVMDEQAALEALLSVLMAQLSGANLIHDVGYMESGLTGSYEMIVLTDELIAMTDHIVKGIEISEDTLMLDELHTVGPGGHFLDSAQTLKRFRDFWFPGLLDRRRREQWLEAGATTLGQRLNTRVKEIIKEHRPQPLDADKKQKIQEILAQASG
ncbi:MAG: trimethylamine methyltransferase family protein [Chloroflexi bacterium]|nr:trimethylamine methyltransferase family protein [Chloroflexota bacterium]